MAANKEKCPSCGQFIKAGSPFCIRCGAQINKVIMDDDETSTVSTENTESTLDTPKPVQEEKRLKPASYVEQNKANNSITETTPVFQPVHETITKPQQTPPQNHNMAPVSQSEEEFEDSESGNQTYMDGEPDEEMYEEDLDETDITDTEEAIDQEADEDYPDDELDDDEAFNTLINAKKTPVKSDKPNNKVTSNQAKKRKVLHTERSVKTTENDTSNNTVQKRKAQSSIINTKENNSARKTKSSYNPNSDSYYDNVLAEVDARISHFSKENVVLTISFVILCIVILIAMVYCIVL